MKIEPSIALVTGSFDQPDVVASAQPYGFAVGFAPSTTRRGIAMEHAQQQPPQALNEFALDAMREATQYMEARHYQPDPPAYRGGFAMKKDIQF